MPIKLEVCVDSIDCAVVAANSGASRIELCSALSEGGLTPSAGLMAAAVDLPVPVYAMIRPRGGGFCYSEVEISVMQRDIKTARDIGLAGLVFGVLNPDQTLDMAANKNLISLVGPMGCTLHRAFDEVPDPLVAMEQATELGFERILTSGQCERAEDGLELLAELSAKVAGRISIMPGSGISAENVATIVKRTNVNEIHGSCSVILSDAGVMGGQPRKVVDLVRLDAIKKALDALL